MIGYENVTCGIYVIKNKKTGQMYVGQSTNVESRFKSHCQIPSIDMAIAIEGEDNFEFNIIEEVSKDDLLERERYWIDFYNTELDSNHYNRRTSRVYFLWDTSFCRFKKKDMFYLDLGRYHGKYVSISIKTHFTTGLVTEYSDSILFKPV